MSTNMTKTQLIAELSEASGLSKRDASAALDALSVIVQREVGAGNIVTIPGIAKVALRARPERQVRNPATGETSTKPADRAVKIAAVKALKDVAA